MPPNLPASSPGDEHWDPQFGPVGANDLLAAVTPYRGKIYAGGYPTAFGNGKAGLLAGFDGTNWFPLNNGVQPGPNSGFFYLGAMTAFGNYLYVGGNFTNADNSGARYSARWDGTNWYPVPGLGAYVFAYKVVGTNLYAGGIFTTNYSCLARLTGTNWTIIPGDFSGSLPVVYSLESDGTNIFVGGSFTAVSGVFSTNVIGWNGTSWFALGPGFGGVNGATRALLYKGGNLYAGGTITNSASTLFTNAAVWNGSSWSAWANANRGVRDFITDGTNIYAGGEFTTIGGVSANRIAKWDGLTWSGLGVGVQGFGVAASPGVYKMAFDSNGWLYAAGNFNQVGGVGASHIAAWDGANWYGLGGTTSKGLTHFSGVVNRFLANGSDLYVSGVFTEAGNLVVNGIAKWDGANWSGLNGGLTGTFTTGVAPAGRGMAFLGTDLYVGGNFTNAGGVDARGIARWDGNNWFNVGDADATVRAVANDGGIGLNYLYVGGSFTNIGGVFSPGFAVWNGGNWFTLGILGGTSPVINAISVDGLDLYIGGIFTNIGSYTVTNIARWNWIDSLWHSLGGVNGTVSSLAANNGTLYAGGTFTVAGGVTVNRIARWNGSSWSALGSGAFGPTTSPSVSGILLRGSDVYIAGTFTNAGGLSGTNSTAIAKWDGASWSAPFGSGLVGGPGTATAAALASIGNDLFVGGNFSWAGDKPSMFFARWNDQLNFYPPPHPLLTRQAWLTNAQFRFRLTGTSGERYVIYSSSNLATWTPRLTNSATLYDFTDTTAANSSSRFYRAILQ